MTSERTIARQGLRGIAAALALVAVCSAGARADDYDPQKAGHPVRILAYAVHPVGVVLDILIFRPAHWIGSLPVVDKLFGHELYDE